MTLAPAGVPVAAWIEPAYDSTATSAIGETRPSEPTDQPARPRGEETRQEDRRYRRRSEEVRSERSADGLRAAVTSDERGAAAMIIAKRDEERPMAEQDRAERRGRREGRSGGRRRGSAPITLGRGGRAVDAAAARGAASGRSSRRSVLGSVAGSGSSSVARLQVVDQGGAVTTSRLGAVGPLGAGHGASSGVGRGHVPPS